MLQHLLCAASSGLFYKIKIKKKIKNSPGPHPQWSPQRLPTAVVAPAACLGQGVGPVQWRFKENSGPKAQKKQPEGIQE